MGAIRMNSTLDKLLNKSSDRVNASIFVTIKEAFSFLTPVFLIGAFALAIRCFPVTVVREFIETALGGKINDFLKVAYDATYGFAAVYLVIVLSYLDSRTQKVHDDIRTFAAISTVICYFAFLGPNVLSGKVPLMQYTNMANVFSALLIAIAFNRLFFAVYNLLLHSKSDTYTTTITRGIHCIPAMCFCLILSVFISEIISFQDGINNFNDLIITLLAKPFESIGATYFGGLLIMLVQSVLWMFGVHGNNVFDKLLTSNTGIFAFSNGNIMSKPFIDTFVLMGGCGTAFCLFAAILIFSHDKRKLKLCKLAGLPLIFNINEILVFGVPIVFNPIYVIPFVFTPMVSYTIAYLATYFGLVPQIINCSVQWTTPVIISGYQATGSIKGSVLQLFILIIGTIIYFPFVRMADKIAKENEIKYLNKLTDIYRNALAQNQTYNLSNASISLISFEDDLFAKLNAGIMEENIGIKYQPQVKNGRVISAEALLRFKYNDDIFVYPPLAVEIARNRGVFGELSKVICKRTLGDLVEIQKHNPDFKISVNLGLDLIMDEVFKDWMIDEVLKSGITPGTFGIEITEDANISDADVYQAVFDTIRQSGIRISMDDFSMGNTSITILKKNYFDYVKIDGSLVKALDNERVRSIVSSIINLGKQLNFEIVAEYVETKEQRDKLLEIGCEIFQGYLYYKDMPIQELIDIIKE